MELTIEKFKVKKPQDRKLNITEIGGFEKILADHGGSTIAERKYDGHGILIDTRSSLQIYSLQKNPWDPNSIPELQTDLADLPAGFFIGELVGRPTHGNFTNLDEFAAVSERPMDGYKPIVEELAHTKPLEIRLYDVLALNGDITATLPGTQARELVDKIATSQGIRPVERKTLTTPEDLWAYAKEQFANRLEGLVVKRPDSPYSKPGEFVRGGRTKDWIKIKKKVTFDLAVLGLYNTKTQHEKGWPLTNVLLGAYNEQTDKFETMTKLTIANRDLAEQIYGHMAPHCEYSWQEQNPHNWQNKGPISFSKQVQYSPKLQRGTPRKKVPFMYVTNPKRNSLVLEVSAMDVTTTTPQGTSWHSCGLRDGEIHSLRQPIYERMREKLPMEATSTQQIQNYVNG